MLLVCKKGITDPHCILNSMWSDKMYIHYGQSCFAAVPHYSVSQEMDMICFCSVSVTIATLKLHCFNALRRWKPSPYLLCVFVCVKPISLSHELLSACRRAEAESAPPILRFRRRREGGEHFRRHIWRGWNPPTTPPCDRATHLYSLHVQLVPQES